MTMLPSIPGKGVSSAAKRIAAAAQPAKTGMDPKMKMLKGKLKQPIKKLKTSEPLKRPTGKSGIPAGLMEKMKSRRPMMKKPSPGETMRGYTKYA